MRETVTWKVEGEFITNLAREMFWDDGRTLESVTSFLRKSLICDGVSDEEFGELVEAILNYDKKLVGVNTLTLVDDDTPMKRSPLKEYSKIRSMYKHVSEELEEIDEHISKIAEEQRKINNPIYKLRTHLASSNFVDIITWSDMFKDVDESVKNEFGDLCNKFNVYPGKVYHGSWEWIQFYDKKTNEMLSSEDMLAIGLALSEDNKEDKEDTNPKHVEASKSDTASAQLGWGWLYPSGKFVEADFGDHEKAAYDIVKENGWEDEYFQSNSKGDLRLFRDFLVYSKGFVLLHNPSGFGRTQVCSGTRRTKKQNEFLFDYFTNEGDSTLARIYFNEEDIK